MTRTIPKINTLKKTIPKMRKLGNDKYFNNDLKHDNSEKDNSEKGQF